MPRNKEALIRYRIINRLLIEKKSTTIEEMREACERALDRAPLGLRTIAGDISDMRSDDRLGYHAPMVCDRETGRYSYSDPEYSTDRFPIGSEELQVLKFAATVLNQFRDISYLSQFQGTVQKIIDAIDLNKVVFFTPRSGTGR